MSVPHPSIATRLAAVAIVSAGYGLVLPILPRLLKSAHALSAIPEIGWHAGLLTGLYSAALVVFAPMWGWLADRMRDRSLLPVCLVGFGASMLLSLFPLSLGLLYTERFVSGAFASGITPIVSAELAMIEGTEDERARRFSWIGLTAIAGFLLGPMLSGWLVSANGSDKLPFLVTAALAALTALAVRVTEPSRALPSANRVRRARKSSLDDSGNVGLMLRSLGFLVAASVSIFEIRLALRGAAGPSASSAEVTIMLVTCSLSMLAAQLLVFSSLVATDRTPQLIKPALAVMGASLLVLPHANAFALQLIIVALFAVSAGVLFPILSYWTAATTRSRGGTQFGKQAALINLGQTLGSVVGGVTTAEIWFGPAPLVLSSLALFLTAFWSRNLSRALRCEACPRSEIDPDS